MTAPIYSTEGSCNEARQAEIMRIDDTSVSTLGVCLYLSSEDLEQLGIDIEEADAVAYAVAPESGQLELEEIVAEEPE